MFRKVLLTFGILLVAEYFAFAQGTLKGTIIDAKTKEPLPFANVIAKQDGKQVLVGVSDFDGIYTIKPLAVGKYDLEVRSVGYATYLQTGISVKASGFTVVDVELKSEATVLEAVEVVESKVPVIEIGTPESGARISDEDIKRMPGNSVDAIVAAVGGVGYDDGGTGTARGESGMVTMQGNVRKRTGVSVPKDAIAEIQVILGGTPASIGEAVAGTQIITLKPPTSQFKGSISLESLLDYRLYNILDVYLTGPVIKKNYKYDDGSSMERTLVGFRLSARAQYEKSPFYRVRGHRYRIVNDEKVQRFEESPLSYNPLTGAVNYAAEVDLHASDFDVEVTRLTRKDFYGSNAANRVPNLQFYSVALEGALNIGFSDYTTLTITGEFDAQHSPQASISPLTMPLVGSTVQDYQNMVLTVDFTQRFPNEVASEDEVKSVSPIKNVMYNITGMVNRSKAKLYNENFGSSINDVFKYGYIGKFITEKRPTYEGEMYNNAGVTTWAQVQNNWRDVVQYLSYKDPANNVTTYNPILANYNEQLFTSSEFSDIQPFLTTIDYIRGFKGLFNGDSPSAIYGLLNNVGVQGGSFQLAQNDYLYLQAKASADIFEHEIEIGFQYDQLWNSSYSLNAYGLWTIMRQNANRHISMMDKDNPHPEWLNGVLYVNYDRLYDGDQQTAFDQAFRDYLGEDAGQLTWIDIDRYSPEDFQKAGGLEMFSASELFNSGNPLVAYAGYDHTGKKYNSANWDLEKFFNPGDSKYQYLPSFSPIYMAGYIQDKFYFQDLIFNVGVRVDYFNGNQYVMKDPYLLYESYTVGDLRAGETKYGYSGDIYSGAGDDWVPYVSQVPDEENQTAPSITGYRDPAGNWYDHTGTLVTSPSAVNGVSGKPTPYRTENGQKAVTDGTVHKNGVFERYTPQIVAMPRIAFSFPIGDRSQFKASYDIIARRPSSGWEADYYRYLFLTQYSSINNPNLKPEKITNYELGFQQALNSSSAISASAYYKETRDLIQMVQYAGADPNPNYYSYDNKDFHTVKGVTLAYDLRQTKNVRVSANYTLQYAEGTGLSTNTMTELIKEGYTTLKMLNPISDDRRHEFKANVDFRYGAGAKYNGPTITKVVTDKETGEKRKKEVKLLENFGINFLAVAQSGRPYTKAFSNSQPTIVGSYRGARLPWAFYFDIVAEKVWPVKVGKKDTYIAAALTIKNLFDIRNVLNVFPVTGNPEDNGYLTDPETQSVINAYLDPQAYRDIYSIAYLNNSVWNYSTPRTVRLSISYHF